MAVWVNMILIGIVAVFAALMLLFSYTSTKAVRRFEREKEQDLLNLTVQNIDTTLSAAETMLYQIFSSEDDVQLIETEQDETRRFTARQNIANTLSRALGWSDTAEVLFYHYPDADREMFLRAAKSSADTAALTNLQQAIEARLSGAASVRTRDGFLTVMPDGAGYYIRYIKVRNSYAGMCFRTDEILGPLLWMSGQSESGVFLSGLDGAVYSKTVGFPDAVDFSQDTQMIHVGNGNYLQLSSLSSTQDFYIGSWTNLRLVEQQTQAISFTMVGFAVGIALVLLALSSILIRDFTRPILAMAQDMKRLGNGEWDIRVPEKGRIREFSALTRNFNEMVSEIKDLKIANYEKELDAQRAYLQYLQLQINPHFYLNVLNIIYSLAQVRDFEKIQKITLALVEYSRYTFREPQKLVTVQDEIGHVENYLRIQQMRFPDRVEYHAAISPEIEDTLIPPFIIQTFVENSIKYAVKMDRHTVIRVSGQVVEIGEDLAVRIEIHDNGNGYSAEVLGEMRADGWQPDNKGNHTGLNNAMKRLELTFGSKATLILKNEDGARAVIIIPLMWQEGEEDE